MDLIDALTSIFYPAGRVSARRPTPAESAAAVMALFVLPLVEIAVTILWHVKEPRLLFAVLPLAFGALSFVIARPLTRFWLSFGLALGCAFTCFVWGLCLIVLSLMTWSL